MSKVGLPKSICKCPAARVIPKRSVVKKRYISVGFTIPQGWLKSLELRRLFQSKKHAAKNDKIML